MEFSAQLPLFAKKIMRYIFFVLIILFSNAVAAQFTFNAKVGINGMHVRVASTKIPDYRYSDGLGWQVGGNVEYQTSSQLGFFLYMGAAFRHSGNDRDSAFAALDTGNVYSYRPNFVAIPYGIGYKFPLKNKDMRLKVYVGLQPQIGVGGKLKTYQLYYNNPFIDPNASTELQKTLSDNRKINFGDNASSKKFSFDYAIANWGVQTGIGLDLVKMGEIELLYSHGFTNALPGRRKTLEIAKFSFLDLNLKLDLPNKAINKHLAKNK